MKIKAVYLILVLLTACSAPPAVPTVTLTIPPSPTLTATLSFTETPVPTLVPEQWFAKDLVQSENGDYKIFKNDTAEIVKIFAPDKDGNEVATIDRTNDKGEKITLSILQKDILDKGVDQNGNHVTWVAGWSQTTNKDTGEISYDVVDGARLTKDQIAKDALPHFSEWSDKVLDGKRIDAQIAYLAEIALKYPVRDLFPKNLDPILPEAWTVIDHKKSTDGSMEVTTFYADPKNLEQGESPMKLMWNSISGTGTDRKKIEYGLGENYPMQYMSVGWTYISVYATDQTGNQWGAVVVPAAVLRPDESILVITNYEDEVDYSKNPPAIFSNTSVGYIKPGNGPLPALLNSKSQITSLNGSIRMAEWLKVKQYDGWQMLGNTAKIDADKRTWKGYKAIIKFPDGFNRIPFALWLDNY